jgi:hypothetical protein
LRVSRPCSRGATSRSTPNVVLDHQNSVDSIEPGRSTWERDLDRLPLCAQVANGARTVNNADPLFTATTRLE